MVKNALIALFFLSTNFLAAGEFTASVSSTQVDISESFYLNLTLKDTSPKEAPDVAALKTHFLIKSIQQSTKTTIHNGTVSSSVNWRLYLLPKAEGEFNIAAMTIHTAEGALSTEPIAVQVVKRAATAAAAATPVESPRPTIASQVSNPSPYKNEPFTYTAVLTSKTPLYHVQMQKMQVEDAMVELLEEPQLKEKIINGTLVNAVEFRYLITPLKAGKLTIPSLGIQGAVPQPAKKQTRNPFSSDFDPMLIMDGFNSYSPFAIMTDETVLDIQPSIPGISPWLTARSLSLEEQWPSDQVLRVGEPLSRNFLVKAIGLKASQLPHLEDLAEPGSSFRVYSDKPIEQEKIVQGTVYSTRSEQYTLIPQEAGSVVLPEISIAWWDSVTKEKRISTIAERAVNVLPALTVVESIRPENPTETLPVVDRQPWILYGVIAGLIVLLAGAVVWGILLQRKMSRRDLLPAPRPHPAKPDERSGKHQKLPDLNPT